MYELSCPYCGYVGLYFKIEAHFDQYVGCDCLGCRKIFYVLHRRENDFNVEIRTDAWIQQQLAAGDLKSIPWRGKGRHSIFAPGLLRSKR